MSWVGVMGNADCGGELSRGCGAVHPPAATARDDVQIFFEMGAGPEHGDLVKQRDALGLQSHVDMPGRVSNEVPLHPR